MRRTRATAIIALLAIGAAIGGLINVLLLALGRPMLLPPYTLPLTLVTIGAILLAFAVPIRRAVRGKAERMIDPFQATRVLLLGKASALTGALLAGFSLGLLGFLLSRSIAPGVSSWGQVIAALAGAILLTSAGLIVEYLCTLPKDTDDDPPGAAPAS